MTERETKWHSEIGLHFGADFWSTSRDLVLTIKLENEIKWMQFQIVRNSLFTNYRVSKFNRDVSPYCSFCTTDDNPYKEFEIISHLFYDCMNVRSFLDDTKAWLSTINVILPIDKISFLFGLHSEQSGSLSNQLILYTKYFIWKTKQQEGALSLVALKKFLKYKLDDLRESYKYMGKLDMFDMWQMLYDNVM